MFPFWRRPKTGAIPVTSDLEHTVREHMVKDAAVNTLAGSRFDDLARAGRIDREFSVLLSGSHIRGVLWHGVSASVVSPYDDRAVTSLAEHALTTSTRYASIVGLSAVVKSMWDVMEASVGPAREVRSSQPLLEFFTPTSATPHPAIRPAEPSELETVFPAAVNMFREEVGTDPLLIDGGRSYKARVEQLIAQKKTYVLREGNDLIFKADVGAVFGDVAQIHGVWVSPRYRGQGYAGACMAAVAQHIMGTFAPRVTLYVNDFNLRARKAYHTAGFREIGELATVLL